MPNPSQPTEPYTQTPEEKQAQRDHGTRQLVLAYKRCFATESGKTVLADLKHRFGFDRWPAEDTEDERKIARRVFAMGPLFHVEKQLKTIFRAGKPKRPARKDHP